MISASHGPQVECVLKKASVNHEELRAIHEELRHGAGGMEAWGRTGQGLRIVCLVHQCCLGVHRMLATPPLLSMVGMGM